MNQLNEISDDEFVPFLQSLGVDTFKKSFEWLLNDPNFAGILRWMYSNLDETNALTPREEYRYNELKKQEKLLSINDTETSINCIQQQFKGLCLPGNKESLSDFKMNINMQKERLAMLTQQDNIIKDLIEKNEQIKEDVTLELTHLNASQKQCSEDLSTSAEECRKLAEDVESITESVMDIISGALDQYTNTQTDQEMSKKFFTFGPFESYRQSQALFRSHFDLFSTKRFIKRQDENVSVEELTAVLAEAGSLEAYLTGAAWSYIEMKSLLAGEQAKLALVGNYTHLHPSQVTVATMEAQSALELLDQEEVITTQQLKCAIKQLVDNRTRLAVETTVKAAMVLREQIHSDLLHLSDITQQALHIDRILYSALRHELRTIEELLQFAAHLWRYSNDDQHSILKRIELMNEICSEQELSEENLLISDAIPNILSKLVRTENTTDVSVIINDYYGLNNKVKELKANIMELYAEKDKCLTFDWSSIHHFDTSTDPQLATLIHTLNAAIKQADHNVLNATDRFTNVKKGDPQNLRKLWQWFLTDQQKFIATLKGL